MKARVKATGEIIEVRPSEYKCDMQGDTGTLWRPQELEFNEPDYWTRLEHQYAGIAMQGLMSNIKQMIPRNGHSLCDEIVDISVEVAHALVEKFKKEEK